MLQLAIPLIAFVCVAARLRFLYRQGLLAGANAKPEQMTETAAIDMRYLELLTPIYSTCEVMAAGGMSLAIISRNNTNKDVQGVLADGDAIQRLETVVIFVACCGAFWLLHRTCHLLPLPIRRDIMRAAYVAGNATFRLQRTMDVIMAADRAVFCRSTAASLNGSYSLVTSSVAFLIGWFAGSGLRWILWRV